MEFFNFKNFIRSMEYLECTGSIVITNLGFFRVGVEVSNDQM